MKAKQRERREEKRRERKRASEREKSEVWRFDGEKIMCGVRCDCIVSEGVGGL